MIDLETLKDLLARQQVFVHIDDGDRAVLADLMNGQAEASKRIVLLEAALEAEKAEHMATAKRWWKISAGLDKAISTARRIMRAGGKAPTLKSQRQFADAYLALDKRRIRQ